jgi:ketosteroid isomerase-like protein
MLGVLVVCLTGIIGQRFIITERKRVIQTLDGIVAALVANDVDRVVSYLTPEATHSRERARWALGRVEVQSASYRKLEIDINKLTSPPTAKVTFFGLIGYRDRKGEIPYNNYASNFTIELRKAGDRWLVREHTEEQEYR